MATVQQGDTREEVDSESKAPRKSQRVSAAAEVSVVVADDANGPPPDTADAHDGQSTRIADEAKPRSLWQRWFGGPNGVARLQALFVVLLLAIVLPASLIKPARPVRLRAR